MGLLQWFKDRFSLDRRGGAIQMRGLLRLMPKRAIVEAYIRLAMGPSGVVGRRNWFGEYLLQEHENQRLRAVLSSDYHTRKELNHALHVADLETRVKKLRHEVRTMQECAERHNRVAFATGLIVNCTGCEAGKPFKGDELTEERVQEVEIIASRLRTWWEGQKYRNSKK